MFDVTTREIFMYEDIGPDDLGMFGPERLQEGLRTLGKGDINLRVNSYGGSVDCALAMVEMLSRHDGAVNVTVDSIAASAASLFPAYFPSTIAPHARVMIHLPWCVACGSANDLRAEADVLDIYGESLIEIYTEATGKERDEVYSLLEAETWVGAKAAVEMGLADSVGGRDVDPKPVPANRFKNVPQDLVVSPVKAEVMEKPEDISELTNKLSMLRLKCKLQKAL